MRALRLLLVLVLALSLVAASGGEDHAHYPPPYEVGISGGDEFNMMQAGEDGRMVVGRAYPVPSFLSCDAKGGFMLYELTHHAESPADRVAVAFSDAAVDPYVFVTVNVIDADGEFLGTAHQRGLLTGSGELTVPLAWPEEDTFTPRDIRVQFGLEMTSACPSTDGGTIKFDDVGVGS